MADIYRKGGYFPMEMSHYVELIVKALEQLPAQVVVGRLTGDGAGNELIAPLWSRKKGIILNEIDKKFYTTDSWQGKCFLKSNVNGS